MKNCFKSIFKQTRLPVILFSAMTASSEDLQMVRTKIVDGIYFGITSSKFTTNNTPVTDALSFGIWRTGATNKATVYIPTATEFLYQITLVDSHGIAQPKTPLGNTIGTRFSEFQPDFSNRTNYKLAIEPVMDWPNIGLQHLFFPFKPGHGDGHFYTPNDLFETTNPGSYDLQISFQIILRTGHGSDKTSHLVRFPSVTYPLLKAGE